jgi:DNA-binding NtrC family response regulator
MAILSPQTTILILEDYDAIRIAITKHRPEKDYNFISAGSLHDAVIVAQEEHPQIVIFDAILKTLEDALVAVSLLHGQIPNSKIIVIDGQFRVKDEAFLTVGAMRVLHHIKGENNFELLLNEIITVATASIK